MVKNGFILPIVILTVFASIAYVAYTALAHYPPESTKKVTMSIHKYPKSSSWEHKDRKTLCMPKYVSCTEDVHVSFTTTDNWSSVYGYYKSQMNADGWTTKGQILTSIPTSIVFVNPYECEVTLSKQKNKLFKQNSQEQSSNDYMFTVSCDNPN